MELGNKIKDLLIDNLKDFESIKIAGPGFINLKFTTKSLISIINEIQNNHITYGKKIQLKNYNIEFVFATQQAQCTLVTVEELFLEMF